MRPVCQLPSQPNESGSSQPGSSQPPANVGVNKPLGLFPWLNIIPKPARDVRAQAGGGDGSGKGSGGSGGGGGGGGGDGNGGESDQGEDQERILNLKEVCTWTYCMCACKVPVQPPNKALNRPQLAETQQSACFSTVLLLQCIA